MTYEETMDRCSIIRDTLTSGRSLTIEPTLKNIEWVTMCAEAAEKQISKKPKITIYNAFCPNCDYSFGAEVAMDAIRRPFWHGYCPVCGQRIDWSEEE